MDQIYGILQTVAFVAMILAAVLTLKRPSVTKLTLAAGLALIAIFGLLKPQEGAETPLQRQVRTLESRRNTISSSDPVYTTITEELELAEKVMAMSDSAAARRVSELEKEVIELKDEQLAKAEMELRFLKGRDQSIYDRLPFRWGLDLRGGTEVRLALRPDETRQISLRAAISDKEAELSTASASSRAAIQEELDNYKLQLSDEIANRETDLQSAADTIRNRLNASGVEDIPVIRQGSSHVLIQLPGMDSGQAQQIISRIQTMGHLEFRWVIDEEQNSRLYQDVKNYITDTYGEDEQREIYNFSLIERRPLDPAEMDPNGTHDKDNNMLYDYLKDARSDGSVGYLLVEKEVQLTGESISRARGERDLTQANSYMVSITLTHAGAKKFEYLTANNIGRQLGIILDGKLNSAPSIRGAIPGGRATITGNFTAADAENLAVVLRSGSLKVAIEKEYENTVGPTLGEDSIRQGITAVIFGLIVTLGFMLIYYNYRSGGLATLIAMVMNIILIAWTLSGWGATITLPGIAGLVLTIGMAVDANVLIFERIREEMTRGHTLPKAIALGYEQAFVTIVDANVTSFITALILYSFGTEAVKGFAATLMIGIIFSMFTAIVITRWIIDYMIETGWMKDFPMMQIVKSANFDFMGKKRTAAISSIIVIVVGMLVFFARGEANFGHDFTGGTLVQIALSEPLPQDAAREHIKSMETIFPDIGNNLQSTGDSEIINTDEYKGQTGYREYILRTKLVNPEGEDAVREGMRTAEEFRASIRSAFPTLEPEGLQIEGKISESETAAYYTVLLNLKEAMAPDEIRKLARDYTELVNVPDDINRSEDSPEVAGNVKVVRTEVGVSLIDPLTGDKRTDTALEDVIREQFRSLRRKGLLQYTEPYLRFASVGPAVAGSMGRDALYAIFLSLIAIFIYMYCRFQYKISFGVGAVVALFHNVLICVGLLSIVDGLELMSGQIDLTVIAALLTVIGYSLNDTIVIFDRIRENARTGKPIPEIVNPSLNQTLSRTVITSLTTLFTVLAVLIWGGEVIRSFAFVLFVGILVGTYASLFIASPTMVYCLEWGVRYREKKKLEKEAAKTQLSKATK